MVLGISFRGKSKKKDVTPLKPSPSLPSVLPQGIPWPENLVDIGEVKAARKVSHGDSAAASQPTGKEKTSSSGRFTPSIGFHRPFRAGSPDGGGNSGGIASLFTSRISTGGGGTRTGTLSHSRSGQRRKVAPTLNIMVAGARGTGKSSLLKLFLDTSLISPLATPEQKQSVETFLSDLKPTKELRTACVEIAENRFDRILLTLIDTAGLDYTEGKELRLERDVSGLVKYLDMQFDETMGEESKVIRQSKGDQHVHLCIYLIDPNSIMTASVRQAKSHLPGGLDSSKESEASYYDEDATSDAESEDSAPLTMNPAEIRVIKRLAARVNVLPVIARTDALTESRLNAVKKTVRKEIERSGIGFGVFSPPPHGNMTNGNSKDKDRRRVTVDEKPEEVTDDAGEEEEDRQARPVIRIRPRKSFTGSERSRSRRRRSALESSPEGSDEEPPMPESAVEGHGRVTRSGLGALLPFAMVSPQIPPSKRHKSKPKASQDGDVTPTADEHQPSLANGHGEHLSPETEPQTPSSANRRSWGSAPPPSAFPSQYQTPQNVQALAAAAAAASSNEYESPRVFPRGVYVRKYKWGTLDVLDPAHCDYVALRTSVISTHFRGLKVNTREVLYEKYRTEKLLARRATRNIGGEERKRLLQDLGL